MTKQADEIAQLKQQMADQKAELEALKAAQAKANPPKSTLVPMSDAEHRDWVHQMNEKRMSMATPPSVVRDLAVLDDNLCAGIRQDRHAPTSPSSMIPRSQQRAETGGKSSTPGYVDPRPLSPPPGIDLIDKAVNAALPHGPEWGKSK